MTKKMPLAIWITLSAISTVNFILAAGTDDVKLITNPHGRYINAREGESFNVSCKGVGGEESKFSSIKWMNSEGTVILEGNPSVLNENKLFLTFINPKIKDNGSYRCSAVYDNETKMELEIFLTFHAKHEMNGMKPEFNLTFENVTLVGGKRQYIKCLAEGEQPITYSWYNQEEDKISEDESQSIYATNFEDYSLLNFEELKVEHEGTYTCTASNARGLGSKVYLLNVINPSGRKPEFLSDFYNYTADEGERLKLSCFVQAGDEPITYSWYNQNGEAISKDSRRPIYFTNSGNQSVLTIHGVKSEHEGTYTCAASNKYGNASKVFSLQVQTRKEMKPEFYLTFESVTLVRGKWQYLQCLAQGEKPITYSWYNQEKDKISEDDRNSIHVTHFEEYSLLNFEELKVEHAGTYTCTASNAYGYRSKMYLLNVINQSDDNSTDIDTGNGTSKFEFAKVVSLTARSVFFYIQTSGPVKYIDVKYKKSRDFSTETRSYSPTPVKLYKIGNLLPGAMHTFQFRTIPSKYGEWSPSQDVMLLPDVPEVIFRNIGEGSVKLQWIPEHDYFTRGTIDKYEIKYFSVISNSLKNCTVTIEILNCVESTYTISGLQQFVFYQIEVRAHTAAGYGEPLRQKIYVSNLAWKVFPCILLLLCLAFAVSVVTNQLL